jgi:hypothetical protein
VTKSPLEFEGGGLLRDRYGRRELTLRALNAPLVSTDMPSGCTVLDGDGREQVVLSSWGSSLSTFDITDPVYGAQGDGVTDDSGAFNAASLAGARSAGLCTPPGAPAPTSAARRSRSIQTSAT